MTDRISGGVSRTGAPSSEAPQERQSKAETKALKGRGAQKEASSPPVRQDLSASKVAGKTEGKSWRQRAARADGLVKTPKTPAPYKGIRTRLSGITRHNPLDVRLEKFQQQFAPRAKAYDARAVDLNVRQQKIYLDNKSAIASLLKQSPSDTLSANKQFGEIATHARAIDDLFREDSSYLAKLQAGGSE